MPARHAAGVIVRDELPVVADRADHVAFHDLHVVNVVEQFESFGADPLDQLDSPRCVVAHVILVIDLAVQQLHADVDLVFLGNTDHTLQATDAIFQPFFVRHAAAVAGEANNVRIAGIGDDGNGLLEVLLQLVMVFQTIETVGDAAGHAADHGADQAMLF